MPKASAHDREYFRKIGRWKHETHDEALREQLARTGIGRLAHAFELMLRGPYFKPAFPLDSDDHPEELYERARQRGLYRP